ncbi:RHS repeat-associated core domain-containing protein [Pseudomonas sp. 3A(2025)]
MLPSTSVLLCHYRYDPLDRLASTRPAAQDGALRFYRKNRLATHIQGAILHTFFGHDDQLLAQQQRSGKSTETSLLATDLQGSVLHGVDGAGIGSRAYSVYGHQPAESGLSCLMGLNGELRDPVTGHYLLGNGYRAFNPVLMRFNSPDELSPFGRGGLNTYAYCQGDPVNFRDSTGGIPSPVRLAAAQVDDLMVEALGVGVRLSPVDTGSPEYLTLYQQLQEEFARFEVHQSLSPAVRTITPPASPRSVNAGSTNVGGAVQPRQRGWNEWKKMKQRIHNYRNRGAVNEALPSPGVRAASKLRGLRQHVKDLNAVKNFYRKHDFSSGDIGSHSFKEYRRHRDDLISAKSVLGRYERLYEMTYGPVRSPP